MKSLILVSILLIGSFAMAGTVQIDSAGSPSCFESVSALNKQLVGQGNEPSWVGYSNVIDSDGNIRSTEIYEVVITEEGPGEVMVYEVLGAEGSGCAFVSAKAKYFSKDLSTL